MPAKKNAKLRKPTYADADLALKLYDLRRESEMRKARNFMVMNFNPQSGHVMLASSPTSSPTWLRISSWMTSSSGMFAAR